jgi:hypothetical protein
MKVYIVTVQGRFVDVFLDEHEADSLRIKLYMGGADGATVIHKVI